MNRQVIMSLSPKVAVVVAAGVLYLLIYFWASPSEPVVAPPAPAVSKLSGPAAPPPAALQASGEDWGRLNPFDVPAVFLAGRQAAAEEPAALQQERNSASGPGTYGGGRMLERPARLTGIIVNGVALGDDGVSLAVLSSGGKQARAYRPGEAVNGYRIVAITGNAVVFNGPAGRETLPVATQVSKAAKSNAEERTGMNNDPIQTVVR
ncbi:hypothetical protein HSX37_02670|uniref:Type IV pilus biogenesis n=1 Tax=Dendrosporobacter quercicolus TaxID=146817 RepID=A0A1G9M8F3_9FIRM|nr:hypothetical protein [Dendrosporobacter quercicolus]NSL46958.1 hypothetical protein [Dendrosporobacter quercicolus DSM 1736]SDL70508.1 hypothetical protein SAMN04488502_101610 [Dendrosporobacter quercicolus]